MAEIGYVALGAIRRVHGEGGRVGELPDLVNWLVYGVAAVVMIAATASAVLFGLALRFVAEFLQELNDDRERGGPPQHTGGEPETPG